MKRLWQSPSLIMRSSRHGCAIPQDDVFFYHCEAGRSPNVAISSSSSSLQNTGPPLSHTKAPEFTSEASYVFFESVSSGYFRILLTTPAPTVRPPSRIAKRKPSSIAIGAISCTFILMLSPGITILTSSGSIIVPVTSVVRK